MLEETTKQKKAATEGTAQPQWERDCNGGIKNLGGGKA
jgi:hypothetical protein